MTDQPTRTLTEEQDARHAELERTASEAIRTGRLTVSVPAIDLLTAMATLGAYRDLAGLGDRIPAREPATDDAPLVHHWKPDTSTVHARRNYPEAPRLAFCGLDLDTVIARCATPESSPYLKVSCSECAGWIRSDRDLARWFVLA